MGDIEDEVEETLDDAARGRSESTPVAAHLLVIVVLGTLAAVVIAVVLGMYLAL